ncbi:pyridoxamine 5'-phosphate oxidase family protein, partial [Streptomyces mirabilis]
MSAYPVDPHDPDPAYLTFWRERHLCTLTTLRADGSPHVVPVGVTPGRWPTSRTVTSTRSSRPTSPPAVSTSTAST